MHKPWFRQRGPRLPQFHYQLGQCGWSIATWAGVPHPGPSISPARAVFIQQVLGALQSQGDPTALPISHHRVSEDEKGGRVALN